MNRSSRWGANGLKRLLPRAMFATYWGGTQASSLVLPVLK
jgi:hypothetical protein